MILTGYGGARLAAGTASYDAAYQNAYISRAPWPWRGRIRAKYNRLRAKVSEFAANTWLRETGESFADMLLPLHSEDADICAAAERLSNECMRTASGLCGGDPGEAYRIAVRFCEARGVRAPLGVDEGPAVARMSCARWWRRRLRAMHGRAVERHAVALGYVHGKGERYISDANVQRRQTQKRRNAETLAGVEAINQHGEAFSLAELAERSTANPAIRRGELMTRIAGLEHVAREMGHAAEFWTGTAPSEYHAQGGENPKFKGATARDGQAWLSGAWARFRAWAGRHGVRLYGFRIAEPHQDGCPHWHLLLFMPAGFVARARAKFRRYFLRNDEAEADAKKSAKDAQEAAQALRAKDRPEFLRAATHARRVALRRAENADASRRRFAVKFVRVEMDGAYSAAGYIVKYIAKNIDGYQVQKDLYGHDAIEGAARIDAWASTHGIRQFQQIGGAPVGPWRELRRLKNPEGMTGTLTAAHAAADVSGAESSQGWADYTRIQGGPMVRRADLRVRVAVTDTGMAWDAAQRLQVPAACTRYGEPATGRVWGVRDCIKGVCVVSRVNTWEIRSRNGNGARRGDRGAFGVPRTRVNNCTGGSESVGSDGEGLPGVRGGVPYVGAVEAGQVRDLPALGGCEWLTGSDFEEWAGRDDVRPEFVAWWRSAARPAAG